MYRAQNRSITGFPTNWSRWCTGEIKEAALKECTDLYTDSRHGKGIGVRQCSRAEFSTGFSKEPPVDGGKIKVVHYIGIAADEPERIERHIKCEDKVLPLVQIGWDEDLCGLEAKYMGMLSPTYESGTRDGCWFCHNQRIGALRDLRHKYPELWAKLLKLDADSPVTFKPDGHTVLDFDRRFAAEDDGLVPMDRTFKWSMLDGDCQMALWNQLKEEAEELCE